MPYPIFSSAITNLFDKFVGAVISGSLPPDFTDDLINPSTLLSYWDGTNASPTTKKDLINGYDMVAVEGPCLTLEVGDTVLLPMNDDIASNRGTGVMTYDGFEATVTTAGTFYGILSVNGLEFPLSEGAGGTFRDTTGTYEGEITAVNSATMWTENTQDDYFHAMDKGYYVVVPDDGIQYPYDPAIIPNFNLGFEITGAGTLTIEGNVYTAGRYHIENLIGDIPITADLLTEDEVTFSGDIVTGVYPNFSIFMDETKQFLAGFSSISLCLDVGVIGQSFDDTVDNSMTLAGDEYRIYVGAFLDCTSTTNLCQIDFTIRRTASGGDLTYVAEVWSDDGVLPKDNRPLALLATSDNIVAQADLTDIYSFTSFDFSSSNIVLQSGVRYWLVVHAFGTYDAVNYAVFPLSGYPVTSVKHVVNKSLTGTWNNYSTFAAITGIKIYGD